MNREPAQQIVCRHCWRTWLCVPLIVAVTCAGVAPAPGPSKAAGAGGLGTAVPTSPTGDFANGAVLPDGRLVTPAGTRYTLGDLPLGVALSPDGNLAVAINSGYGDGLNGGFNSYCEQRQGPSPCPYANPPQPALARTAGNPAMPAPDESLSVVDLRSGSVSEVKAVATTRDPAKRGAPGTYNFFYNGVVFSPDGRHLYADGGGNDAVYDFPVQDDVVGPAPLRTVTLPGRSFLGAGFTKGLAVTPDGRYLLVSHEFNNALDIVNTATYQATHVSLGIPLLGGQYPYGVAVSADGRTAYVALQGAQSVAVVGLSGGRGTVRGTIRVGDHPVALALSPDGSQLYVANANDDTLDIVTTADRRLVRSITLHVLPHEAIGSAPDAVAVSADGRRIYVALAGDNAVAVLGAGGGAKATVPAPGDWAVLGFIPTGWYPSAVAINSRADTISIVSAKGLGSRPTAITSTYQYDGDTMPGLLQVVRAPDAARLRAGAIAAASDSQFAMDGAARSRHNPIPAQPGGVTPIQHVILIVRENRTFDQELGDVGVQERRDRSQVDADPSLTVFGRDVTPNAHALVGDPVPGARDPAFAAADNFYSNGEASIQGHYWTTSADVTDYVEKSWIQYYSPRNHLQDPLSSIAEPHNCSIFQSALAREDAPGSHFSFRDYGEAIGIANAGAILDAIHLPGNASPGVPEHCTPIPRANVSFGTGSNFDLDADNRVTAKAFLSEVGLSLDGSTTTTRANALPNFSYLIMAGDHTGGLAFKNTPRSRVAQNDAGLGLIVQALSRSAYWSSTAIFVMEDDSQDGLDHRDGHRNLLYVISPYAKHVGIDDKPGYFSHYHYSQASVLRTIELICGLPPLSTYDQHADPLYDLFQDKDQPGELTAQDLAPYTLQPAPSFIDETSAQVKANRGALSSLAARESRGLDLRTPDAAGPLLEVINWQLAHPDRPVPAALRQEQRRWRPSTFDGPDRDGG